MKKIIYQVLVRHFGNSQTRNIPYGTIEENGVGKFSDFTETALKGIRELGVTHIWLTGVLHHTLVGNYTHIGIPNDIPYLVKGRAGSPYAIKDYYNVNPDLADDPERRLEEFTQLIERIHQQGMKVIIDIVPNHVARQYHSISLPKGVKNFGEDDNTTVIYARNNNFYYNIGEKLQLPTTAVAYKIGEASLEALQESSYEEFPAKWTGNTRSSSPEITDWYETIKLNYGITPEGKKDFDTLPEFFRRLGCEEHQFFWRNKIIPDTWVKMKHIVEFWLSLGVDGFRYDMAEMVPVEFWSYLNSFIKIKNPCSVLIAEIYNPALYEDFLRLGKMDYLYNKVGLYDTLRDIICYEHSTDRIDEAEVSLSYIGASMLNFLENHDEQRIASSAFAGDAKRALPAMVVSTFLHEYAATMIYAGQEVGERAEEQAGFGSPSRTSIFDYIGVPALQRWTNQLAFDGGMLCEEEQWLRDYYRRLLQLPVKGTFENIHKYNRAHTPYYNDKVYSFVREDVWEKWIIITNFSPRDSFGFDLALPPYLLERRRLPDGAYPVTDQLYGTVQTTLHIQGTQAHLRVEIAPLQSLIFLFDHRLLRL